MKCRFTGRIFFLVLIFSGLITNGFSEGTKQFRPVSADHGELCIDTTRNKFAVVTATADYRLYIHISDYTHEAIYFGFGTTKHNAGATEFRFYRPDNLIDTSGTVPTVTGDRGFIDTYDEAVAGPTVVAPGTGYWGLRCTPTMNGDYYLAFKISWLTGMGSDDYKTWENFDLTVVNTSTWTPVPGRLWSRAWQMYCEVPTAGSTNQSWEEMYVYSADSIVTKVNFNGMIPGTFTVSCNHSGCYPSPPTAAATARQSVNGEHTYPEYDIFLNDPDIIAYPSGVLGGLDDKIPVTAVRNCDGTVDFTFGCTKAGNVELKLLLSTLGSPYTDRTIPQPVTKGMNTIHWDGYDQSVPPHAVPNGASFPFVISYVNGLTHLPLYDVEFNNNGFLLDLVRPTTTPPPPHPLFYWDDSNFSGGTTNLTGCLPNPPTTICHNWNSPPSGFGNNRTVNTWWYAVSTSTVQTTIIERRAPNALTGLTGTTPICQGGVGTYSVNADPNSTSYHWVWDGGSQNTTTPNLTINFPTTIAPGTTTVYVNGVNSECGAGPVTSFNVTVNAYASPTITGNNNVCINSPITYTTQAGKSNYQWSCHTSATPVSGGGTNENTITLQWNTVGVDSVCVNYADNGCSAPRPVAFHVTVNPLPTATISGTTSVCQNAASPLITLTGSLAVTLPYTFSYKINNGSIQNISTVSGNTVTIPVPTNVPGTFTYYLLGVNDATSPNPCTQVVSDSAKITVYPLPTASASGTLSVCLNSPSPQITFTGSAGTAPYTFTYNMNGGSPQVITSVGNTVSISVPTNIAGTFQYNLTQVSDVHSCNAALAGISATVTVNPLPNATIVGTTTVCQDFPTMYQYQTSIIAPSPATYTWTISGGSGTFNPSGNSNPVNINWNTPGTVSLKVKATSALSCADSSTVVITINPKPAVSVISCYDAVTTKSARRFQLKGGNPPYLLTGSPLQGAYTSIPSTPALQADPGGYYYFNPSLAATGTYQIFYRFTNQFGCPNTTTSYATIIVQGANPPCSVTMTDPRDGKIYKTAMLAGQCWMTENLNYSRSGTVTASNTAMTDNCVAEKYCPPADPTCAGSGGFYQWDELIQYANTDVPYQGVCPPAWHVPTETEWNTLINSIDPVFTPPSAKALVGSELKDPSKSFRAFLDGINYLNTTWYLLSGPAGTMFWTSSPAGSNRAVARGLNDPNSSISRYPSSHANAFPLRCVKD
jgi:uncharacterized protein (TIGR02145 family)